MEAPVVAGLAFSTLAKMFVLPEAPVVGLAFLTLEKRPMYPDFFGLASLSTAVLLPRRGDPALAGVLLPESSLPVLLNLNVALLSSNEPEAA